MHYTRISTYILIFIIVQNLSRIVMTNKNTKLQTLQ